ncbi:glycosyltransferase [Roseomonas oryzicola]|uniref:Glycosyltransferase n=1 Tax=Neoroseomonas oryzicola TaxID=535904 RepID=A0A9X9WP64_9PROT|nr:glycosyltransferase [Neoroseomonas oryzicola]MBR0662124.1 glycosyltransferase [Neoroseomonas oryzicola]NKE20251.1 glycosyltransferase [Neoroseomonas oryzicola]
MLFVVTHSAGGGTQELWANLTEGFRGRGHQARLVALYPHQDSAPAGTAGEDWQYLVKQRPTSLAGMAGLLHALVRLLRREAPDVVLTAMPAANALLPLAATLAGGRSRVVISHHALVDTYAPLLKRLDALFARLPRVSTVVCVSDAVAASLDGSAASYGSKRRTIHNALPPSVEARLAGLSRGLDRQRARGRSVVATGRLAAQKNYPVLVRAAAEIPDVDIQVVGAGPDEAALKALAQELGVTDKVRFLGHRPREEALARLANGDIFVQPSLFEGHSLALIEAAKLGLPLIVSDVPVQIEGITAADGQRCGIAVDPHDPAALAAAVRGLLDEPKQYGQWSELARHLGSSSTFDTMLDQYEALL